MRIIELIAVLGAMTAPAANAAVPQPRTAAVPGFGEIAPVPNAANQPDPSLRYRVIFPVTKAADAPTKVNPSLDKVARFVNLLASRGVHPAPNDLTVIVSGPATPLVLSDAAYESRFGAANPNTALIRELRAAGATVHVCGQALHGQKIAADAVSSQVTVDLSAMTTIATLQLKGWALMPE